MIFIILVIIYSVHQKKEESLQLEISRGEKND
jgi:hypothetical protein